MPKARILLLLACAAIASPIGKAAAAPLPYPQAVSNTDKAARAVLARAGRESCLRGKLTNALLGLSRSCEASGSRTPLCSLADQAVVVTPMSVPFMDQTSRQLLQLIDPAGDQAAATSRAVSAGSLPVPADDGMPGER